MGWPRCSIWIWGGDEAEALALRFSTTDLQSKPVAGREPAAPSTPRGYLYLRIETIFYRAQCYWPISGKLGYLRI